MSESAPARSTAKSRQSAHGAEYSRKDKSLGLLCENFVQEYGRVDNQRISLDAAATTLGVERRRIYDIVNVLESVGIVSRQAKNCYAWRGFSQIHHKLNDLQTKANSDLYGGPDEVHTQALNPLRLGDPTNHHVKIETALAPNISTAASIPPGKDVLSPLSADGTEKYVSSSMETEPDPSDPHRSTITSVSMPTPTTNLTSTTLPIQATANTMGMTATTSTTARPTSRKEKSLGVLSQRFVQLFLLAGTTAVSLDSAAVQLLGRTLFDSDSQGASPPDGEASKLLKTKVRRLYDIANILTSLNLIEKVHTVNRKPAFKWLGPEASCTAMRTLRNEASKRPMSTASLDDRRATVKRRRTYPTSEGSYTHGSQGSDASGVNGHVDSDFIEPGFDAETTRKINCVIATFPESYARRWRDYVSSVNGMMMRGQVSRDKAYESVANVLKQYKDSMAGAGSSSRVSLVETETIEQQSKDSMAVISPSSKKVTVEAETTERCLYDRSTDASEKANGSSSLNGREKESQSGADDSKSTDNKVKSQTETTKVNISATESGADTVTGGDGDIDGSGGNVGEGVDGGDGDGGDGSGGGGDCGDGDGGDGDGGGGDCGDGGGGGDGGDGGSVGDGSGGGAGGSVRDAGVNAVGEACDTVGGGGSDGAAGDGGSRGDDSNGDGGDGNVGDGSAKTTQTTASGEDGGSGVGSGIPKGITWTQESIDLYMRRARAAGPDYERAAEQWLRELRNWQKLWAGSFAALHTMPVVNDAKDGKLNGKEDSAKENADALNVVSNVTGNTASTMVPSNDHIYQSVWLLTKCCALLSRAMTEADSQNPRKWPKFGACALIPPGPESGITSTSDCDIYIEWVDKDRSDDDDDDQTKQYDLSNLKRQAAQKAAAQMRSERFFRRMAQRKENLRSSCEQQSFSSTLPAPSAHVGDSVFSNKYVPPARRKPACSTPRVPMPYDKHKEQRPEVKITNLSFNASEADVEELCRVFGPISRVYVSRDKRTRQPKGHAYVVFTMESHAEKCVQMLNGFGYDHLILSVTRVQ